MIGPGGFMRRTCKKVLSRLDVHTAEVISGASLALVLRSLGAALAFSLNVFIGRLIGAEGAGLYFLALSVVTIGAVITKLGLDNTLLRFVAVGASSRDWNKVIGVFRMGMPMAASTSLGAALLLSIFSPWMAERLFAEAGLTSTLQVMSLGIFSLAMMTLLAETLKGLKRIHQSMLVSGVLYPGIALLTVWPLAMQFGAPGAAMAYVLGTGSAALIGWAMWRANMVGLAVTTPSFDRAMLWKSCRPLWTMSIIDQGILPWVSLFLLGVWGTAAEVGIFGAATRVAMLLTFFLTSVNTVIAPKFAELHAQGDIEILFSLASRFALMVTLAASPIFLLFIFAGDWVMSLFGPEFIKGGTALAILAVGQAVNTMTGSVGYLLMMTGHERDIRSAAIVSLIMTTGCALMVIPSHGLVGAAASGSIALATKNVVALFFVKKRFDIKSPKRKGGLR